jgi:hypothetical protein
MELAIFSRERNVAASQTMWQIVVADADTNSTGR